jgi:hypothetical protein
LEVGDEDAMSKIFDVEADRGDKRCGLLMLLLRLMLRLFWMRVGVRLEVGWGDDRRVCVEVEREGSVGYGRVCWSEGVFGGRVTHERGRDLRWRHYHPRVMDRRQWLGEIDRNGSFDDIPYQDHCQEMF